MDGGDKGLDRGPGRWEIRHLCFGGMGNCKDSMFWGRKREFAVVGVRGVVDDGFAMSTRLPMVRIVF